MPLSKRRRLFTPKKHKSKASKDQYLKDNEVTTARGRLKGALREMLEPTADESDGSSDETSIRKHKNSQEQQESSDEDAKRISQRQSYVLKLFDRSVDLSQFNEDSPLYPICRAWIINQPKANYKYLGKSIIMDDIPTEDSIELPGPEGPPISKIPELLPEQKACNKDNINLNYCEAAPPSREQLLQAHVARWGDVRAAWQQRAALVETRYTSSQHLLNAINVNSL